MSVRSHFGSSKMAELPNDRDRKRDRVDDGADLLRLGRKHYASQSAIAHLLHTVEKDGAPTCFSRHAQYLSRKRFARTQTPHGTLVCTMTIGPLTVAVQNPAAMLHYCVDKCPGFTALMNQTILAHGSDTPLSLILYADGVSPADTLTKHDGRKFDAVYWSFKEFGQRALCSEESWFCLTVIRSTELEQLESGLSHALGKLCDEFFFNPRGTNFATTGIFLQLPSGVALIKISIKVIIADEPALKDIFLCKGHAGLKSCMLCSNCI